MTFNVSSEYGSVVISDKIRNIALILDIFTKIDDYYIIEGVFNLCDLYYDNLHLYFCSHFAFKFYRSLTFVIENRSDLRLKLMKEVCAFYDSIYLTVHLITQGITRVMIRIP